MMHICAVIFSASVGFACADESLPHLYGPTLTVKVPSELGLHRVFAGVGDKIVALNVSNPRKPTVLSETKKLGGTVANLAVSADGRFLLTATSAGSVDEPLGKLLLLDARAFPHMDALPVPAAPSGKNALYSRIDVGPILGDGMQIFFVALNDASVLKGVALALGVKANGTSPVVSMLGRTELGPVAWAAKWSTATGKVYVTGEKTVSILSFSPDNATNVLALEAIIAVDTLTPDGLDVNSDGSLAFVASDADGLTVVNVSAKHQLSTFPIDGESLGIELAGNTAVVAADPSVFLVDGANASNLQLRGSCLMKSDGFGEDLVWAVALGSTAAATGGPDVALVAHNNGGLQILGLSGKMEVLSHFGRGGKKACLKAPDAIIV